jgi:hypothetical protein
MKISKGHKLTLVNQEFKLDKRRWHCSNHNDCVTYFDLDCQKPICRDCHVFDHSGHFCIALPEAADQLRREVIVLEDKAIKLQESLLSKLNVLTPVQDKLIQNFIIVNGNIDHVFEEVSYYSIGVESKFKLILSLNAGKQITPPLQTVLEKGKSFELHPSES